MEFKVPESLELEHEELHNRLVKAIEQGGDATVERTRRLIPYIQTEIVPNAGHVPNVDQAELVNAHVLKFLAEKL